MENIKVTMLNASHAEPAQFITGLTTLSYKEKLQTGNVALNIMEAKVQPKLIKNLIEFDHTGLLEHVSVSILVEGGSRSLLAQITRHRLFSFISASQHYIDYSQIADFVVPHELQYTEMERAKYIESCKSSVADYIELIEDGVKHEVARQVLPNGMRNNLVMTGNLRQWLSFIKLRACGVNTSEIQMVAGQVWQILNDYAPEIFQYAGPACVANKGCDQGHRTCGTRYSLKKIQTKYK